MYEVSLVDLAKAVEAEKQLSLIERQNPSYFSNSVGRRVMV